MSLRPALVLLLATAPLLGGCGWQQMFGSNPVPEPAVTGSVPPAPSMAMNAGVVVPDCRTAAPLFRDFQLRTTAISWVEVKRSKEATLTLDIELQNTARWRSALSNSETGVLYALEISVSPDGTTAFAPKETSGAVGGMGIHELIPPGEPKAGKLVFQVPRGSYTLRMQRKFAGTPVEGPAQNFAFACGVPDLPPDRPAPKRRR